MPHNEVAGRGLEAYKGWKESSHGNNKLIEIQYPRYLYIIIFSKIRFVIIHLIYMIDSACNTHTFKQDYLHGFMAIRMYFKKCVLHVIVNILRLNNCRRLMSDLWWNSSIRDRTFFSIDISCSTIWFRCK